VTRAVGPHPTTVAGGPHSSGHFPDGSEVVCGQELGYARGGRSLQFDDSDQPEDISVQPGAPPCKLQEVGDGGVLRWADITLVVQLLPQLV
jgi:hypothetical protein